MFMVWKFRILALTVAAPLAAISIGNLVVDIYRAGSRAKLLAEPAPFVSHLAPLRTDIQAEDAQMLARQALGGAANGDVAETTIRRALVMAPHNARLWATAAALKARENSGDPSTTDLLRLSYYTGPHDLVIIPLRLGVATSGDALTDTELRELAKGDISAMLSPVMADGKHALAANYSRASRVGKTFIEEAARAIDPAAADELRRAVP